MALFFDGDWFDARLQAVHLTREDVARALGVGEAQIAEIWKDQRELSARDVSLLAALLAATPQEVAQHAGVSTPVPKAAPTLADLAERISRVEAELTQIKAQLHQGKPS